MIHYIEYNKNKDFKYLDTAINKAVREIKMQILNYTLDRSDKTNEHKFSILHKIFAWCDECTKKYNLPSDTFRVEQSPQYIRIQKTIGTELGRAVYQNVLLMHLTEVQYGSYTSTGTMFWIENIRDYKNKSCTTFSISKGPKPYVFRYNIEYQNPEYPRCLYPTKVEILLFQIMKMNTKQLVRTHHHSRDVYMKDGNNILLDTDDKRRYQSMPRDLKEFEYNIL